MKEGSLLFVYGTLRQGECADLSRVEDCLLVGEDAINGKLYDLGWYPGVKSDNPHAGTKTDPFHFDPGLPSVRGDVFQINSDALVQHLDDYEGYPTLYDRIETMTAGGRVVWVYTYNNEPSEDRRIISGDWINRPVNVPNNVG